MTLAVLVPRTAHSSTSTVHRAPCHAPGQAQAYRPASTSRSEDDSEQAPPFWQGLLPHSLTSSSQRSPLQPVGHWQAKPAAVRAVALSSFRQVPPLWQGALAQASGGLATSEFLPPAGAPSGRTVSGATALARR